MGFKKNHIQYSGIEKGWFKKGHKPWNKEKSFSKKTICSICKKNIRATASSYCKECANKRMNNWREKNREKSRLYARQSQRRIRRIVIEHYGGKPPKCACCKENKYEFLCIDHINNDGAEHRKRVGTGTRVFRWLKKNNFPKGFQVLCYNCNLAKGFYGYCPHQKNRRILPK